MATVSEQNEPKEIYIACSAAIRVRGVFDPAEITEHLGIEPTRTHRKGDQISRALLPASMDLWLLKRRVEPRRCMSSQVRSLLDAICGLKSEIRALAETHKSVEIVLGYTSDCDNAGFGLEAEVLNELAQLGLNVQTYVTLI